MLTTRQVEQTITKPELILPLTVEEAAALSLLLQHVGGHPDGTLRGVTDGIRRKLPYVDGAEIADNINRTFYFAAGSRTSYAFRKAKEAVQKILDRADT